MPTDSKSAKALKALRARVPKLSVRQLSKELDWAPSTYSYYEDDYKDEYIPIDLTLKLERVLVGRGSPPITRAEVLALGGVTEQPPELPPENVQKFALAPDIFKNSAAWPRDVPILGVTVGGLDGDFTLNKSEVNDYAPRTPTLARASRVFALYVQGSSMSKWREPGDLVYVDPIRPAKVGDKVVVECHPEHAGDGHPAYLKELLGRTPTRYRLKQYNPESIIEIPVTRVIAVHRVIEWSELLGF